jgi:hypothetical protein
MADKGQIDPEKKGDLSKAFAICTAAKKKHPGAARQKAKEGVPKERVREYETALKMGRESRAREREDEETQEEGIVSEGKDNWKLSVAVTDAKKMWGKGWALLTPAHRRAEVALRGMALISSQDEDIAAKIGAKFYAMANAIVKGNF